MKRFVLLKVALATLLLLLLPVSSFAIFSVENEDGVTIYYDLTSIREAEVTGLYTDYNNSTAYEGDIVIPSIVRYGNYDYAVTAIGNYAFYYCKKVTSIKMPNTITSIGEEAFEFCSSLALTDISENVTEIGDKAFYGCTALTELNLPNNVTSIGKLAFANCSGLKDVTIPVSITTLGGSVFYQCTGLTEATIPESVTSIGVSVFSGCTGLVKATVNSSSAGSYTFQGCSSLKSAEIGNSVTDIGIYAFDSCNSLETVVIGSSVTKIGNYAFLNCTALSSVICLNPEPPTCKTDVFGHVDTGNCTLIVPEGSYDKYAAADTWKDFLIQEEDLTGVDVPMADNVGEVSRYTPDGREINGSRKGLNIIRYGDGSVKKVIVR